MLTFFCHHSFAYHKLHSVLLYQPTLVLCVCNFQMHLPSNDTLVCCILTSLHLPAGDFNAAQMRLNYKTKHFCSRFTTDSLHSVCHCRRRLLQTWIWFHMHSQQTNSLYLQLSAFDFNIFLFVFFLFESENCHNSQFTKHFRKFQWPNMRLMRINFGSDCLLIRFDFVFFFVFFI